MDSNTTYEQEIDLKDLMFAVLHKWKGVILVAVIFAVLFGGAKGFSAYRQLSDEEYIKEVRETYESDLEQYENSKESFEREIENLKDNITQQEEYLEKSVLMNASPYDISEARADLFIKTDYQIMPGMAYQNKDYTDSILYAYKSLMTSNLVMDDVADEMGMGIQYLKELIEVECGSMVLSGSDFGKYTNMITVKVCHAKQKDAEAILDKLLSKLHILEEQINQSIGVHTVTVVNDGVGSYVDLNLVETQKSKNNQLLTLNTSLEEKEKALRDLEEPEEPETSTTAAVKSGIKYGVLGGVLGGFMIVFFVCVIFMMSDKMYMAKDLKNRFRIKLLGILPITDGKKTGRIDSWLNQMEGRGSDVEGGREYELIAANIENLAGDAGTILVTGSVGTEKIESVCKGLSGCLANIKIVAGDNLLRCAETLKKLPECDGVILVEQSGKSVCSVVGQEIDAVNDLNKAVIGCIVFE